MNQNSNENFAIFIAAVHQLTQAIDSLAAQVAINNEILAQLITDKQIESAGIDFIGGIVNNILSKRKK